MGPIPQGFLWTEEDENSELQKAISQAAQPPRIPIMPAVIEQQKRIFEYRLHMAQHRSALENSSDVSSVHAQPQLASPPETTTAPQSFEGVPHVVGPQQPHHVWNSVVGNSPHPQDLPAALLSSPLSATSELHPWGGQGAWRTPTPPRADGQCVVPYATLAPIVPSSGLSTHAQHSYTPPTPAALCTLGRSTPTNTLDSRPLDSTYCTRTFAITKTTKTEMPVPKHIFNQIKAIIPPLNGTLHKGQSGRVGVLGGALDYTGAPFFASMSALRFGADLSHVICSPTAAGAIKSYSPDLIVHPILREEAPIESVKETLSGLLSRLHVLIIGPGLGREDYMQTFAKLALHIAKEQGMYVVLDADGLYMVGQDTSLIQGYRRAVLTPNVVEFKRLSENVKIDPDTPADERAMRVSRALGGVTVLQKGEADRICTNTGKASKEEAQLNQIKEGESAEELVVVDVPGGYKRCGGLGDVLSGAVGTIMAWGKCYEEGAYGDGSIPPSRIPLLAAVGGSMLTRTASRRAFGKQGRSLVTQDLFPELGHAFEEVFGSGEGGAGAPLAPKVTSHSFNQSSADIILPTADQVELHVHSQIPAQALPIVGDMFCRLLQLPCDSQDVYRVRPIIPVAEDGKFLERLLRFALLRGSSGFIALYVSIISRDSTAIIQIPGYVQPDTAIRVQAVIDITLRSTDNVDFHIHRAILSVASDVFRDMLSLPPPHDDAVLADAGASPSPPSRPIIPLTENGKTLERLLCLCYPINKQPLNELEGVVPVLKAALKYDMEWPITLLTRDLLEIAPKAPLKVWACACQCELKDLVRSAALEILRETAKGEDTKNSRLASFEAMLQSAGLSVLDGVVAGDFFRLREFILAGDREAPFVGLAPTHQLPTHSPIAGVASTTFQPHVLDPDIVICCPDATTHRAHAAILSLHSPVFASMIADSRADQSCKTDVHPPPIELKVEVDSDALVTLLELCYVDSSGLPTTPSRLATLLVAAERYQLTAIQKIVKDRWDEVAKDSPLDAYFVAIQHGLTPQARLAARDVLEKPIGGAYARSMESSPALSYYRLLSYYTACSAAVKAKAQDPMPQWHKAMRSAYSPYSYSSSHSIQEGGSMEQCLREIAERSEEGPRRVIAELAFSSLLMHLDGKNGGSIWPMCSRGLCSVVVKAVLTLSSDLGNAIVEAISQVELKID
ncbi:hypothetical protein BD309DRAFT_1000726 [Dichomitus squalens]|uniref:ATP-dependent (S)-NAD(P)H-hydrate dehydratase n=1 Tax=Dichomitus squalens TaxID=114155 RepID=A0A4Q9PI05_9APHY|nr:hypothetical protein BD309DRAFT_1000726 [Dichomitus squalens]TBU53687.1 hypothetical protein BD310DRAFT_961878 [Dichomitus squalens]